MAQVLSQAAYLVIHPTAGWARIRDSAPSPQVLLLSYVLVYAVLPFLGRALGHFLLDWPAVDLLLDALLYPAFCLALVLALGLALGAVSARIDGSPDRTAAIHLAFFASTPVWLAGILHVLPVPALQTLFPFVGLGWTGWLLAIGAHDVLDLPPGRGLVAVGLAFAAFTLAFVLLTQVLLTHVLSGA